MNTSNQNQLFLATFTQLQSLVTESVQTALENAAPLLEPISKEPSEIIDSKTLMERLDISEPTVIRWRQKGKIPYLQIGTAIRYDYPKVLAALEVNKKGGKIA